MSFEPRLTRNWADPGAIGLEGYVAAGGYAGLRQALGMADADIVELVKASGLRGRGGAGCPTGMKWGFVPRDTGKPTDVVVNFDESEPGTCNNRELVEREPHRLLEGTAISALAIGCETAYIYVRGEYLWQSIVLERAIAEAYADGYLGADVLGSGTRIDVVLHRGAGAYICGEETALLNSLEGLRGQPRLRPPFPAVEGLYASPTVINNVETLMNVPDIVTIGTHQKVGEAIDVMQRYSISQLPVVRDGELSSLSDVIGSLQDRDLLDRVFKNPDSLHEDVAAAMQPPLSTVDIEQLVEEVFAALTGSRNAVVVARGGRPVGVLTRSDLLEYLAHNRGA